MNTCNAKADEAFGPVVNGCRDSFDFTLLFEQSILSVLPSAFAIVSGIASIYKLWKQSMKIIPEKNASAPILTILIGFLCFAAVQVALIVLWTIPSNAPTKFSVPSSALALLLGLLFPVLCLLHYSRSVRPSGLLTLYLIFSILFDAAQARTLWLRQGNATVAIVFTLGVAIKVLMLPVTILEKRGSLKMPYSEYPPEALGGVVNRGLFWWINSLLVKGSSVRLRIDHLFDLDKNLTIEYLRPRFHQCWTNSKQSMPHALLLATLRCFSTNILIIAGFRFALIGFKFCQPLLINRAISLLLEAESQNKTNTGRTLIGATSLIYIGISITTGVFRHNVYRLITMVRGNLVDIIYDKTLLIDASVAKQSAALTLMSTDVERVANGFEVFDALWASPFEVAIAMFLLYREIGLAFLVPVIISTVFILIPITMKDRSTSAQTAWVEATERRVGTTASVLHKMKGIKMSGLSDPIGDQLQALRVSEMKISSRFRAVLSASLTISIMSQVVIPFATLASHVLIQGQAPMRLDTTTAFTTLALVALLANPIKDIARAAPEVASAAGCFQRIQQYICTQDLGSMETGSSGRTSGDFKDIQNNLQLVSIPATHFRNKNGSLLKVTNASFGLWSMAKPILDGINLEIAPGTWTVLTGPIGCGKSTLLLALVNELRILKGSVENRLSMGSGYCAQDPWLPNLSICQIITSQAQFDEQRYWTVVDACLLRRDLDQLPAADQTVIGSNGVSLSGGQKQRLSLARALYSQKALLLLDDVLGGLDATTEQALVENVFGSDGFLRKNGIASVLVSHSLQHARRADHVILMDKGGLILEQGPPAGMTIFEDYNDSPVPESSPCLDPINSVEASQGPINSAQVLECGETPPPDAQEMQSELARQTGDIRLYTYYLSALGWTSALGQVICISSFAIFLKLPTLWVRWWAEAEMVNPNAETEKYIGLYGLICAICLISFMIFIVLIFNYGIPRSSNHLHQKLVNTVMNAPYWFLVSTDAGQITNRFSQDMSLLCLQLPFAFSDTLLNVSVCLVGIVLITMASKYSATIYPGFFGFLYMLQKFYLRTSRQIRLLDLEAKSPIYSHFMQTLQGLTTIRTFRWQHRSRAENSALLNQSQRPFYLMYCIQRWLNLVLDLLVAAVAIIVVSLATQLNGSSSGALGVSLLSIVTFSQDLTYLIRTWTDLETSLGAVARIKDFERATPSEHLSREKEVIPLGWPSSGKIRIENISSGYRHESQLILRNVSLTIEPGMKVGICGRTGSGKSTFLLTLLRMAEIHDGDIFIDDTSIQNVPRNNLRRCLFAIPQDPLFLPGSVRYNIDPFSEHCDEAICSALSQVGVLHVITERGGLDVEMDTVTLSKGQQQLFCLTRAVLSKSKVILLDEITSSVDSSTEAAMMDVVERVFSDRTIIAIAHRLYTIRGFDRIIVLDQGMVIETGSPDDLLARQSAFRGLWEDNHTGRIAT